MHWFNKLPHTWRAVNGFEWMLWKRLPLITWTGTFLPLAILALVYLLHGESPEPSTARWLLMMAYIAVGVILFHWSMVITLAVGCLIVMAMKGPAYVADGYLLPHSDQPRKIFETIAEAKAHRPFTF